MIRLLVVLVLLIGFGSTHASVIVMDFQGNAIGIAPTTYTEDGMRLVSTGSPSTLFNLGNPSPGYANNTSNANSFAIDLVSGDAFQLLSFDIETQFNLTIDIVGNLVGGGTVSEMFLVNTPSNTFTTFTPTLDFSNLASLLIDVPSGGGVTFVDNIRISDDPVTVPEPTTLALMGLGLAGIGYRRHQSKIAA